MSLSAEIHTYPREIVPPVPRLDSWASKAKALEARISELERCLDGGVDCANERITQKARIAEQSALLLDIENWLRPEVVKEPDRTFFWRLVELRRKHAGLSPSTSETKGRCDCGATGTANHDEDCPSRYSQANRGDEGG